MRGGKVVTRSVNKASQKHKQKTKISVKKTNKLKNPNTKISVKCPMCNVNRPPQRIQTMYGNRKRNSCVSPSCVREHYSSDLVPAEVSLISAFNHHYRNKFGYIASGIIYLGSIQSAYNVRLKEIGDPNLIAEEILEELKKMHINQTHTYKVAISIGRFLYRIPERNGAEEVREELSDDDVMYFHSSANNSSIFHHSLHTENYMLIDSNEAFNDLVNLMVPRVIEDIRRPSTKYKLLGNVNATITLLRPNRDLLSN